VAGILASRTVDEGPSLTDFKLEILLLVVLLTPIPLEALLDRLIGEVS